MNIFLGVITGGTLGFIFGYFGRCSSGACPITRNPWLSAFVGALVGLSMAIGKS